MARSVCDFTLQEWYSTPYLDKYPVLSTCPDGWLVYELTPAPKGYVVCSLDKSDEMTAFVPKSNLL